MLEASLLSVFLLGLLGGAHCAGMCGPIVGAIALAPRGLRVPIRVVAADPVPPDPPRSAWPRQIAYNAGRVTSYVTAGALAGAAGSAAWLAEHVAPVQQVALAVAACALVAMGLYLLGALRPLAALESAGRPLWRRLAPLAARALHAPRAWHGFGAGLVWGMIPCGMVYAMLVAALASGGAASGALLALAFGLGTLPNLLTLGWAAGRSSSWLHARWLRVTAGALILAFGLFGLIRATGIAGMPLPGSAASAAVAGH